MSFISGNRNDSNQLKSSAKINRRVENKENEPRKRDEVKKRSSRWGKELERSKTVELK